MAPVPKCPYCRSLANCGINPHRLSLLIPQVDRLPGLPPSTHSAMRYPVLSLPTSGNEAQYDVSAVVKQVESIIVQSELNGAVYDLCEMRRRRQMFSSFPHSLGGVRTRNQGLSNDVNPQFFPMMFVGAIQQVAAIRSINQHSG